MNENQRFWVYATLAALLSGQANDEPNKFDGLILIVLSLGFFVAAGRVLIGPWFRKTFRRNNAL